MGDTIAGIVFGIFIGAIVALAWEDYGYPYEYHAGLKACAKNDGLKEWSMNAQSHYRFKCNDGAEFFITEIRALTPEQILDNERLEKIRNEHN